jgi:hypothetical protein
VDAEEALPWHLRPMRAGRWYTSPITVFLSIVAVVLLVSPLSWTEKTYVTVDRTVPYASDLSDLWFRGDSLFTVQRHRSRKTGADSMLVVTAFVQSTSAGDWMPVHIDSGLFDGARSPTDTSSGQKNQTARGKSAQPVDSRLMVVSASGLAPFDPTPVVSHNARLVAWRWPWNGGALVNAQWLLGRSMSDSVTPVYPPYVGELPFTSSVELALSDTGVLVVYEPRTGLLHLGLPSRRGSMGRIPVIRVPSEMMLRVIGDSVVLVPRYNRGSPASPSLYFLNVRSPSPASQFTKLEFRHYATASGDSGAVRVGEPDFLGIARSPDGHFAIATRTGEVVHAGPNDIYNDSALVAPGPVRAMQFIDDRRLAVAGDFRGIHVLESGKPSLEIGIAAVGTSRLAVDRGRIAYESGPGEMTIGQIKFLTVPTTFGTVVIGVWTLMLVGWYRQHRIRARAATAAGGVGDSESGNLSPAVLPQPPPPPPPALIDAINRNECVLITGSGIGAQSGLPTWAQFLTELAQFTKQRGSIQQEVYDAVASGVASGNLTAAADELVLEVSDRAFREFVTSRFQSAKPSGTHAALSKLRFAGAITTNFDTMLDGVFKDSDPVAVAATDPDGSPTKRVLELMKERKVFLLSLLGRVDRPNTLTFTSRPWGAILSRDEDLRRLLRSVFERYTVFFAGMGLSAIREFLDAIGVSAPLGNAKHFALVGQETPIDATEARAIERTSGVHALGFVPARGWPEIEAFLVQVSKAAAKRNTGAVAVDRPALEKLVLKNIGPFADATIHFHPTWNVFLGDNGVGKSVILRSIGAALLGNETPGRLGERLLRSGQREGSIELYLSNTSTPYTARLVSGDLRGPVQFVSASVSPLRFGNWLVLGFPALRSMSSVPPVEARQSGPPGVADLNALMLNDVDDRLTNLKVWLIDLYNTSNDPASAGRQTAQRLFTRFFQVLAAIAPDAKIVFKSIDTTRKQIWVTTDGVEVPVEALSQGVASVLCWVGVTLQRMYEVHKSSDESSSDDEREEESGPTLVLIDEIDAHMHPAWQQVIVPAISELFPKLQIVATTHSPLIVGNLKKEQLSKVTREGGHALVMRAKVDPAGKRADQLLTSELFEMMATRDVGTQNAMRSYTELAARDRSSLLPGDREELDRLAEQLRRDLSSPHASEAQQSAVELQEQEYDRRIEKLGASRRSALAESFIKDLRSSVKKDLDPRQKE